MQLHIYVYMYALVGSIMTTKTSSKELLSMFNYSLYALYIHHIPVSLWQDTHTRFLCTAENVNMQW
jgi:hypothetical protein